MDKYLQARQKIDATFKQFFMDSMKAGNTIMVNQFSWMSLHEIILSEVDKLKPEKDAGTAKSD
jgi:hypothetical protein